MWSALHAENSFRDLLIETCSEPAQHTRAEHLHRATCTEHLPTQSNLHKTFGPSTCTEQHLHRVTFAEHLRRATCTEHLPTQSNLHRTLGPSTCTEQHLHRATFAEHLRRATCTEQLSRSTCAEQLARALLHKKTRARETKMKICSEGPLMDSKSCMKPKTAFDIIRCARCGMLSGHPFLVFLLFLFICGEGENRNACSLSKNATVCQKVPVFQNVLMGGVA